MIMVMGGDARRPIASSLAPWLAVLLAAGLTLAVFCGDLFAPIDVILPIAYGVPLMIGARARHVWFLWVLALLVVALTFVSYYWGRQASLIEVHAAVLINRGLAALSTLVVAVLLHRSIRSEHAVERHRQTLERQNEELESINEELSQREEEVVRQNEELQSQTEELERQSEELRVTNEELADREKTLEQLLELSRSLSAELTRNEMLRKICEALGVLTNGSPSAILLRADDRLTAPCSQGFGPDGLEDDSLPYEHSFTALITALGQTGYLEDVGQRPDLVFLRPKEGEPVRSVLAAPLRVRGRCIGTIELYAFQRQTWSEAQIAMLESLAAQASISIQGAELVETIRQERRRFEAAFRTVPFGLAVAEDAAGREVRFNPAAAALFNVPLDENVAVSAPAGARLKRYVFRNDAPVPEEELPLQRALRGEEIQGEEIDVVFPAGKRVILLISAAPIYDGRGRVAGAVSAFADISQQKNLQRELDLRRREAEEASVRKTRFLASVSHDIRTPVNAINLMAEVIRRSADNPGLAAQIPQLAERLQANALALAELVADVLDVAHFDSGKVELQESEFLLNDLLGDECKHLLPLAQDKGLRLTVEPPERPIWLRTDRVKLARVIGNLVGNAIKFTEAGGVTLAAGLDPQRQLVLHVRDTGVGIAPEYLAHVFDEFAQLRNPERSRDKGSGLGLTICKRLVEVMGGDITVDSRPGAGSTFTVTLPSACVVLRLDASLDPGAATLQAQRAPKGRAELAGLRVLLVEDHSATREGTARILADEGAVVQEAADGTSALRLLDQGPWDVILLDLMLPDIDGSEVLKALGGRRPAGLKAVIVMTGDLTGPRLEQVRQLGADAVIGKPVDVFKLIEMLRPFQRPPEG
jgi:signal transduction histidine kinase